MKQVRFYTGSADNAFWHGFWSLRLRVLSHQGVYIFARPLRYRTKRITLPDGTQYTFLSGKVRGIAKTDWVPIDKATFDSCIDHRDYRPKGMGKSQGSK